MIRTSAVGATPRGRPETCASVTLDPELTRAVAREKCIVGRAMHGKVPKRLCLFGKRENRPKSETFPLGKVGATLCGRPNQ